jgi:tRNA threonylcarbamoyladenosine biosynthesis protein TsaE
MSELIQKNSLQTGTYDWSTLVYAAIGLFWTIAVHGKYFSDITHSFYWNTKNEKQTRAVGRYIGRWILEGGMILTLKGNLGAGKTTLVKGIAEELGITDHITSPTFTLMNIYPIPEPQKDIRQLIHVDTYRLETTEDLVDIGIEEYLGEKNTVCIVEWPEKIAPLLTQKNVLHITIEQTSGDKRIISMGTYE